MCTPHQHLLIHTPSGEYTKGSRTIKGGSVASVLHLEIPYFCRRWSGGGGGGDGMGEGGGGGQEELDTSPRSCP